MIVVPRNFRRCAPWACVAALVSGLGHVGSAQQKVTTQNGAAQAQVTFSRDIAPILYRSCVLCHRPGESAPFPLLAYTDAKSRARQIAVVTRSRFMPPWLPEEGELKFADELRLSTDEIARIQAWADQGAPEGDPADLPAKPKFAEGWQLGKPDVIARATKPYALPRAARTTTGILYFARPSIARAGWTPSRFARATSAWCITPMYWWTASRMAAARK